MSAEPTHNPLDPQQLLWEEMREMKQMLMQLMPICDLRSPTADQNAEAEAEHLANRIMDMASRQERIEQKLEMIGATDRALLTELAEIRQTLGLPIR